MSTKQPSERRGRVAAERRGYLAETICVLVLRLSGWRILARRMKAKAGTGLGEIDIVARRGRTIAFIEVKARADHTAAQESVTQAQRTRIARAAQVFVERNPACADCDIRFDVMSLGGGWWPQRIADAWRP
ncbi:MAG: YraN family protein [Rhodospirillaceae bacterium]|nr:YraN family protein [Rhodospirillaceae bacterium]